MNFMWFVGLFAFQGIYANSNLPELLSAKGISFVAPGHPDYLNLTTPCMSFSSQLTYVLNPSLDNRRYTNTIRPAVVTFPTTQDQVVDILKIGSAVDHSVVAQSGGVSIVVVLS